MVNESLGNVHGIQGNRPRTWYMEKILCLSLRSIQISRWENNWNMSLQDLIQDNYNSIIAALQVMVSSFFSLCCIDTSGSLEKSPYSPVPSLPPVLSCFCTLSWCFYWACESFILKLHPWTFCQCFKLQVKSHQNKSLPILLSKTWATHPLEYPVHPLHGPASFPTVCFLCPKLLEAWGWSGWSFASRYWHTTPLTAGVR